ncbi:hypothetical protein, partial [Oenococcus oeni]|uniref:hypothetical protein n=1 Tax=Oenococcus oeni TaxID=1247 RepID=UPI001C5B5ED1
ERKPLDGGGQNRADSVSYHYKRQTLRSDVTLAPVGSRSHLKMCGEKALVNFAKGFFVRIRKVFI